VRAPAANNIGKDNDIAYPLTKLNALIGRQAVTVTYNVSIAPIADTRLSSYHIKSDTTAVTLRTNVNTLHSLSKGENAIVNQPKSSLAGSSNTVNTEKGDSQLSSFPSVVPPTTNTPMIVDPPTTKTLFIVKHQSSFQDEWKRQSHTRAVALGINVNASRSLSKGANDMNHPKASLGGYSNLVIAEKETLSSVPPTTTIPKTVCHPVSKPLFTVKHLSSTSERWKPQVMKKNRRQCRFPGCEKTIKSQVRILHV